METEKKSGHSLYLFLYGLNRISSEFENNQRSSSAKTVEELWKSLEAQCRPICACILIVSMADADRFDLRLSSLYLHNGMNYL